MGFNSGFKGLIFRWWECNKVVWAEWHRRQFTHHSRRKSHAWSNTNDELPLCSNNRVTWIEVSHKEWDGWGKVEAC